MASTNLDIMSNNGEIINNNYFKMQSNDFNNYQTNNNSIETITNAINQNLATLDVIQNQMNTLNNLNQESLVKQQQLIQMENNKLIDQLRDLENIQSNIENKTRMIDQLNLNMINQQTNIRVLTVSIILALLILSTIVMYGYGIIEKSYCIIYIIIILISYVILFMYYYNIFYFKSAIDAIFNSNFEERLGNTLKNWSTDIKTIENEWIDKNCGCDTEEEESSFYFPNNSIQNTNPLPGYYYYDGSAPKQLLIPTPTSSNIKTNENIEWVDYTENSSTNYYNYNNNLSNLQNMLNKSNTLVNSKTYTTNL